MLQTSINIKLKLTFQKNVVAEATGSAKAHETECLLHLFITDQQVYLCDCHNLLASYVCSVQSVAMVVKR